MLGQTQLSDTAKAHILDPANTTLVNPANYWEIAIKISLKKYTLHQPYEAFMQRGIFGNGFGILPIEPKHTAA